MKRIHQIATARARRLDFTSLAVLAGALAVAPAAFAQGAVQSLEEVVVTAERTETRLQQTAIAVTAVTAGELEARSVSNVKTVVKTIPNVAITAGPTGGNDGFYFIRGIGQVDSNPAADPGVGTYIDDVYLGRIQGSAIDALDIAQIEVLRGPQGTLFGRNTIGGAVSIITADPKSEFGGYLRGILGSRERVDVAGAVDIPLSDSFAVKVSGNFRKQEGWGKSVYNSNTYGDIDNRGARLKAVWTPNDNFSLKFSADITRGDGSGSLTVLRGFNPLAGRPAGTTPLGVPLPADLFADTSPDQFRTFQSNPEINEMDASGQSLTATWDLGFATLKSITAHRQVSQYVFNDFDATGYNLYDSFFDTDQDQISQELQLTGKAFEDRTSWLLGVYGYNEEIDHVNAICLGTNNGVPPGRVSTRFSNQCLRNNQKFHLEINSWAVFGNLKHAFTDRLSVSLGVRYTEEEKDQQYRFFLDNTAGVFSFFGLPRGIIPSITADVSDSWSKFTPKIGVDYKWSDTVFLYANYGKGFKSGGFDGRPTPGSPIRSYAPEEIDTYEVGVKTDWFDRRLRLNVAAFYSEYTDIQLLVVDAASGFFVLTNAGDSNIKGVEVELTALPIENLRVQASAGFMSNEYQRLSPGAAASGIGLSDKLPVTPDFTGSLSAAYTIPTSLGELVLRGDYNYRSKVSYGAPNQPLEIQKGFGLLDLRATLALSEGLDLAVFGTNVTDEFYYQNAQDVRGALGVAFAGPAAPREWGVEAKFKF